MEEKTEKSQLFAELYTLPNMILDIRIFDEQKCLFYEILTLKLDSYPI